MFAVKGRLLAGAVAGAFGGIAMKAVVRWVDPNSFGLSARTDAKAAHAAWRFTNRRPLSQRQAEQVGAAMHYAFGIVAGALYAEAAIENPTIRLGSGAAFGAALWLVGDEMAVSLSGLEDPGQTRAPSHLSALATHVLYGMIVDRLSRGFRLALAAEYSKPQRKH